MDAQIDRVAIYTRVSTEDQAKEGFSLDAQLERLRAYCKSREWKITGEYIDDGYSGRNTKRPAYTKMMEEMNDWGMLLVIKMDRIHRNSKNFMLMMEKLNQKEKGFTSMTESLDTSTAMGRFVMDIIQRIAQLESEQIGERVYVGMEQKAKINGGNLGFNIPYGYDYRNGLLELNPNEKYNVEKIYEMYINGNSMIKIADYLNKNKIPTKKNKTWRSQTISRILKNPLYCGKFHWKNYIHNDVYPSIIESKKYELVQEIIKNKSK